MKEREIREMVASAGLSVVDIQRNRHWKVTVATPSGTCKVIFPTSVSDYRGLKNKVAHLRNLARSSS